MTFVLEGIALDKNVTVSIRQKKVKKAVTKVFDGTYCCVKKVGGDYQKIRPFSEKFFCQSHLIEADFKPKKAKIFPYLT